jgi:peptidoglycan/LPS O-acetylase OafA/YrhL
LRPHGAGADHDCVTAVVETEEVTRGEADPPANTPGGIDLEFRPDVEGLRAVAILLVVLYHCGVSNGGFIGVDVFFVISGFLITGLLIREHENRRSLSIPGFYARRARRILPAGMLVIVGTIVWAHFAQNIIDFPRTADSGKWAALFAANIHFASISENYFQMGYAPSPLLHYWSLAVEEQFYFVWPAVVLLIGLLARWFPIRHLLLVASGAAVVGSFIWAVHSGATDPIWAFYSPVTRAWELGIGAFAACAVALWGRFNRWVGVVLAFGGLAAICVCAATYANQYATASQLAVPVLGAVAIVIGGTSGLGAGWLLGCVPKAGTSTWSRTWATAQRVNPMRAIGRVSYGWYLLHFPPMILIAGIYYQHALPVHERLWIAAATLGVAFVMYYAMERPVRRSRVLARNPWLSILMGALLVLTAYLVCQYMPQPVFP